MPFNPPIPDPDRKAKPSGGVASFIEAEKMIQVAFLLPCSAFVGWLLGAWLDHLLHKTWIGVVGILFGGISGIVYVVRLAMAAGAKSAGGSKDGPGGPGATS